MNEEPFPYQSPPIVIPLLHLTASYMLADDQAMFQLRIQLTPDSPMFHVDIPGTLTPEGWKCPTHTLSVAMHLLADRITLAEDHKP